MYLAASNPCSPDPDCDGRNERIRLEQSTLVHNAFSGWLGASNGSVIEGNLFEGNGTEPVFDHNIYLSGSAGGPVSGMRVLGNRLYRAALDAQGICRAVSLVVHGQHSDLLIEGNEVWEDVGRAAGGCWGIAVDPGYGSDPEAFTRITIRGNRVRDVGNQAIGVAACVECLIENNIVVQNQPASAFSSTGIAAPNRARQSNDQSLDRITVRNNSIWFGPDSAGRGVLLGVEGSEHMLVSNAIEYAGSGAFDCFELDLAPTAYAASDHNLCHSPSGMGDWVGAVGNLSQWQLFSGLDASSAMDAPGFIAPLMNDLRPASAQSAVVDRAHPVLSAPLDALGQSRSGPPDAGAFEWLQPESFSDGFESL